MTGARDALGRFLYGAVFVLVVPVLLVLWAMGTERAVPGVPFGSTGLGVVLTAAGALLILVAMATLISRGKGLPMNAYPPPVYVHTGIYRLIPHPIYVGFCLCCFGVAVLLRSGSGFWLVAPAAALGCAALVMGFERQDLRERFGGEIRRPLLSLPADEERAPTAWERISVVALVLLPWMLVYELFVRLGPPHDAIVAYLPFELDLPVVQWTEVVYGFTYVFVLLVPLTASSPKTLREFSQAGLIATLLMALLFFSIPLTAPPREFLADGPLGRLLLFERSHDSAAAAFPSFHVVWTVIAARAFRKSFPGVRSLWPLIVVAVALSCITTGMHALVDVVAGVVTGLVVLRYRGVWEWLRSLTERTANSWREWRVGGVRIINHGAYTGMSSVCAMLAVGVLLGPGHLGYGALIIVCSVVMAALWAQVIEGSPSLLRPYGYYGGVIGIVLGAFLSGILGGDVWMLIAVFAVSGPAVQALGRLRCLVQGCCHGREAPPYIGIRYTHDRSRVCRLSEWKGVPLHPTPLYSILWNVVSQVILLRLWFLHAEPSMIAGLYLLFNGFGRFVEEAYRGEPQTPVLGKLRLYQLMSILSVVFGAALTAVPTQPIDPAVSFNAVTLAAAVALGLFTWFAQGVDFPNSNRRFARLV